MLMANITEHRFHLLPLHREAVCNLSSANSVWILFRIPCRNTRFCYVLLKIVCLMDSVGEGEGGKIWENGIETCKYHV